MIMSRPVPRALLAVCALLLTAWGALALWFQLSRPGGYAAVALWSLAGLAATIAIARGPGKWPGARALVTGAVALAVLLGWWCSLTPSHDRVWADDVSRMLVSRVDGDRLVLQNVRNFEWRTETDYTPRWETRDYDLAGIVSADLILSYWMGPHIAHTLVTFGFRDGKQLVFSLEIRKERTETVIIASDERDLIRTRSNARGEQVYLYRLRATPAQLRAVLLAYLERAEALRGQPEFYNTLTSNCTTILYELAHRIAPDLPLDYRLLASGHFAEYAYDQDALTPGVPYAVLQQRGHINARARQADIDGSDFSRAIRVGVPGIR
jgi:hypothetical protein